MLPATLFSSYPMFGFAACMGCSGLTTHSSFVLPLALCFKNLTPNLMSLLYRNEPEININLRKKVNLTSGRSERRMI